MPVRSLKDAVLTITDGASASIIVTLDNGDLSWTESQPINVISDRGVLDHARKANEVPVTVSFSAQFAGSVAGNSDSATVSLYEMLTKTGDASGYTSDEPNSDTWAMVLGFAITDPDTGTAANETITFPRWHCEELTITEGDPSDTIAASGQAMVTAPTIT